MNKTVFSILFDSNSATWTDGLVISAELRYSWVLCLFLGKIPIFISYNTIWKLNIQSELSIQDFSATPHSAIHYCKKQQPSYMIIQWKPIRVTSSTLIFTRSVGTLQPARPTGRVGSKFNWPTEDQCQRSHSKWVFVFIPHLKSKYIQLILSKLSRKSAICPWRKPWLLIVFVGSLRSSRLVKSVTYSDLIDKIGGCPWVPAFEIQSFFTP